MDFIRQTLTIQISTPAEDGEPSGWNFAELLGVDGDMVQILDQTEAEILDVTTEYGEGFITCRECGYTLRRDETDNWIDFTDGDVCYDDIQHIPR